MKAGDDWADRHVPPHAGEDGTPTPAAAASPAQKRQQKAAKKRAKKTTPNRGFCANMWHYFSEFCTNTSIHGIRYLGQDGRRASERFWWFIVFAGSIILCALMIRKTWDKWNLSPVIVSFAQSPTPVWQVPFPAVTICSETKSRQSVFNFTDYYHKIIENNDNFTLEEQKRFEDISLICDTHLVNKGNLTTDQASIDFLKEVAPQFEEMIWQCKWTNKLNSSCPDLFFPMLTEEGVCYTFNMLDSSELFTDEIMDKSTYLSHGRPSEGWTLDNGYPKTAQKDTYPRRALAAGTKAGLTILLRAYEYDLDYVCRGPVQGFKVLLHNPAEMPRVSQQYFRVPLNQEVVVAVKPDIMTTSDVLRSYTPAQRHCFFPTERHLRFYKVYTQQNCEIECLANFTLKWCGCVSYHMPHDDQTAICGSGSTFCVATAQSKLLSLEVSSKISHKDDDHSGDECDCLPACTSLSYGSETSQADFNWPKIFEAFKSNFSEFPGIQMARLQIFFKETQFITSQRSELYGYVDFLANTGGLLGLFMGFSFLSLVEILYFLSLRLYCNVRERGIDRWADSSRAKRQQSVEETDDEAEEEKIKV